MRPMFSKRRPPPATMPKALPLDLERETLQQYWFKRATHHLADTYLGVPMLKFPEDLRTCEHLMTATNVDTVIEIGTYQGGSALWFRDRLRTLGSYGFNRGLRPRVISIDLSQSPARANLGKLDPGWERDIVLVEGDVADERIAAEVRRLVPKRARVMVVEDSGHTFETTTGALENFAGFVSEACYFVVEDGHVDVDWMRVNPDWPRGVLPALEKWLEKWLATHKGFTQRRDAELYGFSAHPRGFLQRSARDETNGHRPA